MNTRLLLLSLLAACAAGGGRPAQANKLVDHWKIRGVALGHYTEISPSELKRKLQEIKELNATHVTVVAQWSMKDVRDERIAPRKGHTTSDATLVRMIAQAKAMGFAVHLFPMIDVQKRKPLEWRGTIKPASWERWWQSYRRFILHYATIAKRSGADIFCVGSELVTTENQTQRWQALIAEVRRRYRGQLLYSANWDHYQPVTFWQHVDLIGLTAYYTIAKTNDDTAEQMTQAWGEIRNKLVAWSRRQKRRLLFTEVGYPSLDGGAVNPWDYTQNTYPDPEEQRRAYVAFARAWSGVDELAGVFFWDWYGKGGLKDRRYTARNKPAAQVIRRWFAAGLSSLPLGSPAPNQR
ncbi:MAG: glycoside hydrolase TIM-barrel-like domain-containing protein [Deltaproteobacteria bacterium]|nr:glycoside hydrolase TIM-barrel-like domain-containing protein [Deltaproteobacteria bacterium]